MLTLPQKQQGVTLVELMIGIAIMAILLTLALPSFTVWLQNGQIRTATESIVNGLQLARAEAVRRNVQVSFILDGLPGSSWKVQTVNPVEIIQSRPSSEGSVNIIVAATPSGASTATFNELGRIVANAGGTSSLSRVVSSSSVIPANQSRNLRVDVTSGGQIRSCDPMFTDSNDPRYCQP